MVFKVLQRHEEEAHEVLSPEHHVTHIAYLIRHPTILQGLIADW